MDTNSSGTEKFLVVYDYGQGGVWAFVRATSPDEIRRRFPELRVVTARPHWMSDELRLQIEETENHDLDEPPRGLLADLIAQRKG